MRIDKTKVVPGSAEIFNAFGGTGVRMTLCDDDDFVIEGPGGHYQEKFVIGAFEKTVAVRLVETLNGLRNRDDEGEEKVYWSVNLLALVKERPKKVAV